MSDETYTSFLDKANEDPKGASTAQESSSKSKSNPHHSIVAKSSSIPSTLNSLKNKTFASEADEPFEPFAIPYLKKSLPNGSGFRDAVLEAVDDGGQAGGDDVQALSVGDFDPKDEYADVVEGVKKASGSGDVKVYRWEGEGSRVWYYVVGIEGGRLVGVRAVSVES